MRPLHACTECVARDSASLLRVQDEQLIGKGHAGALASLGLGRNLT